MGAYSDDRQQYHIGRIRQILVLKADASAETIKEALERDPSSPLSLDRVYIRKLLRKILSERVHRFRHVDIQRRLAEMQDRTEVVIAEMWKIILDPKFDERARVNAGKLIVDAERNFLTAQIDAGIYEKKLGTIDVKHEHTLSLAPELKLPILAAFRNYGIIPQQHTATLAPAGAAAAVSGSADDGKS